MEVELGARGATLRGAAREVSGVKPRVCLEVAGEPFGERVGLTT